MKVIDYPNCKIEKLQNFELGLGRNKWKQAVIKTTETKSKKKKTKTPYKKSSRRKRFARNDTFAIESEQSATFRKHFHIFFLAAEWNIYAAAGRLSIQSEHSWQISLLQQLHWSTTQQQMYWKVRSPIHRTFLKRAIKAANSWFAVSLHTLRRLECHSGELFAITTACWLASGIFTLGIDGRNSTHSCFFAGAP